MRICGIAKTSLLDYPGRVACTIFLGGCNYRCPFCQNSGLVLTPDTQPEHSREEILGFLKKRKGILDGVCITGGEPTLSPLFPGFVSQIKELGYSIKLDTNGSRPDVVKDLWHQHLIDKIAMDIKTSPDRYQVLTGIAHPDIGAVKETAAFLMSSGIEYEFRTTVIRELHRTEDFEKISLWLSGAGEYQLQVYRDSENVIHPGFTSCSPEEMMAFRDILRKTMSKVEIRGM